MSSPTRRHIHRIDNETNRTHCWKVQVQHRNRVVIHHFSDGRYGGKRKALTAAIACRNELLEDMRDERYAHWRRNRRRRNNTSGIVGVGRYVAREVVGGKDVERASWIAFWDGADGKRHTRKFAVNKYGEARAKALACKARREAMAALIA
ncbi:AP2 domain-containing protein [Noviherbaspirillum galbum]|uniref:AP2 domain-containing protein n=1 Tax=Noviherbaspirillum galbum TaxID=2709383 RepID=A0A6B3SZ02_9BURK|nr:AP2 domain-containing protein [Noviherbaspirillum galbum]NEX64202.1 AP2 domain-containing protein [Noviherbaspirillum galbum]